jgi:hypothetical protein
MAIVTLTSDLGTKDHYVAMMKGKLLSKSPALHIVDISHEIKSFNIQQAAFILHNAFSFFPDHTIHLASVMNEQKTSARCILVKYKNYFFAGVDNGLFSLVFDEEAEEIIEIASGTKNVFVVRDILCDAVGELVNGKPLASLGKKIQSLENKIFVKAPESADYINGMVVYIDKFGNAIINISREKFERKRKNRKYSIHWKRANEFSEIHTHYSDVPGGEKLCLFNSNDFLEIAINQGNAAELLGLRLDDTIQIEFE